MLRRIFALQQRMQKLSLDAFVLSSPSHIRYFFGFTGSNAIAIIASDVATLITDRRYTEQARQETPHAEIVIAANDLFTELLTWQNRFAGKRLGLEVAHLTARDFLRLKKLLPDTRLVASERIVERICSIKDASEVDNIRSAAAICARVFAEITALIAVGQKESDIAAEISFRAKRYGSERDPFEPIVASGERSALPHGVSSKKTIAQGDLIVIDFGATVNGYAADCTRVFTVGAVSSQQQALIEAVAGALRAVEQAANVGMPAKTLDAVARDFLAATGYRDYFQHSLGHGLGLNVHELPRIGENSDDLLQAGQVFTLEPGLYLPGIGGVRLEDDYLLTEMALENLSPFPREVARV